MFTQLRAGEGQELVVTIADGETMVENVFDALVEMVHVIVEVLQTSIV